MPWAGPSALDSPPGVAVGVGGIASIGAELGNEAGENADEVLRVMPAAAAAVSASCTLGRLMMKDYVEDS